MWNNTNMYYQNPYGYQQNPYRYSQMNMQQQSIPNWQLVDSIDVVKAKDVDMTGMPSYYPQSDGRIIYAKQLQPDGTSRISVYKLDAGEKQVEACYPGLDSFKTEILKEINVLKENIDSMKNQLLDSTHSGKGGV